MENEIETGLKKGFIYFEGFGAHDLQSCALGNWGLGLRIRS